MIRPAVIGYVPPPKYPGAQAFLSNITKFKSSCELFLYSDWKDYGFHPILNPEGIEGRADNPKWAVNNAIFIMGLRLAAMRGFTHILYVESDCRVGCQGWDGVVFDEYFKLPFPAIAAGSIVAHGCVNGGGSFYKRFLKFVVSNAGKRHPTPIYGIATDPKFGNEHVPPGHPDDRFKPAVFPNGALGVYDMAWMCEIFHLKPDGTFKEGKNMVDAVLQPAWDVVIGRRLYDRFGADVFDVVAHLDSVYSGFGNQIGRAHV